MNNIKFSIIIPIYNRVDGVRRCVENVLAQDYSNYEVILVNDASSDGSGEVCSEYADKYENVMLVNNLKNMGPGLTRNAGLDTASGDYIIFLDSDDTYENNLLSCVAKSIDGRNPDIVVYSLWEEYYDENAHLQGKYSHSIPTSYLTKERDIHQLVVLLEEETMLGYPWNKAYNLRYLRKCGARFTDIAHIEDILFNIEAFEDISSLVVLEDKLYHYRNEATNRLTDKNLDDYFDLQIKRIKAFYRQQKRWGTLNRYALSVMAGEYYRWLLSAVERRVAAAQDDEDIASFLDKEFRTKHARKLGRYLNVSSKLKVLYTPLVNRNIKGSIAVARKVSLIKRKLPLVFDIVKQVRR